MKKKPRSHAAVELKRIVVEAKQMQQSTGIAQIKGNNKPQSRLNHTNSQQTGSTLANNNDDTCFLEYLDCLSLWSAVQYKEELWT